jgi:hypothetical protein
VTLPPEMLTVTRDDQLSGRRHGTQNSVLSHIWLRKSLQFVGYLTHGVCCM